MSLLIRGKEPSLALFIEARYISELDHPGKIDMDRRGPGARNLLDEE